MTGLIRVACTRPENKKHGTELLVGLEDYVACVVASEIGNAPLEACKAQAVAVRTNAFPYYSKGKSISDISVQAFRMSRMDKPSYPTAFQAASETAGLIICYGESVVSPCSFSSSNGGRTTSSEERWGGHRDYLISKEDPYDFSASGGVKKGHGVGMSQLGAIQMAKQGFSFNKILAFYYPGTDITKGVKDNMGNEIVKATYQVEKFKFMANEKWKYVAGAARYGEVDCSGAFSYWYKQADSYMYHGSNTMWRKYAPVKGRIGEIELVPGMPVYKWRNDGKEPDQYKNDGIGNFYHVGLYIGDGKVVEAKGTRYGVVYSSLSEWSHASTQKNTEYDTQENTRQAFPCIGIVTTASGPLNVRSKPSTGSSILTRLAKGERVELKGQTGSWYMINTDGRDGYVSATYITISQEEEYVVTFSVGDISLLDEAVSYLKSIGISPQVKGD